MCKAAPFAVLVALALGSVPTARADDAKSADAPAAEPKSVVYDAASAFEFLKTLTGDWERSGGDHDHDAKSHLTTFRVTAAGSSVMETIFPGEPSEMISMYHMDGDTLLLTHYCALHNAPVMKFEKSDKPGEIRFVFSGGTNFDPQTDMHVHEGVMRVKDGNTLEVSFVSYADGKPNGNPRGMLKRKLTKPLAAD